MNNINQIYFKTTLLVIGFFIGAQIGIFFLPKQPLFLGQIEVIKIDSPQPELGTTRKCHLGLKIFQTTFAIPELLQEISEISNIDSQVNAGIIDLNRHPLQGNQTTSQLKFQNLSHQCQGMVTPVVIKLTQRSLGKGWGNQWLHFTKKN